LPVNVGSRTDGLRLAAVLETRRNPVARLSVRIGRLGLAILGIFTGRRL
jgi:hypothetical protein